MTTAENALLKHKLLAFLNAPLPGLIKPQHLLYRTSLLKSTIPNLDDLLPAYVNDFPNTFGSLKVVTRENSVAGPGIGALLAQLVCGICEKGEGVLMTTPFYNDYNRDIEHPSQAVPVLCHVPPTVDPLSPAVLPFIRQTLEKHNGANGTGAKIQAILLCNPHNPLSRCYEVDTLKGHIELAKEFSIHLIVDEIFGASTFKSKTFPNPVPFISVLSLSESQGVKNIHVMVGPTKDLGASAIKAGLIISENLTLLNWIRWKLFATPISGVADAMLSKVLSDKAFLTEFLAENRKELGEAFDIVAQWCNFHKVPFEKASATVFTLVDFTPILRKFCTTLPNSNSLSDAEVVYLSVEQMKKFKVFLKPTNVMADPLPNRFRMIFTQGKGTLKMALGRIEEAFGLDKAPL